MAVLPLTMKPLLTLPKRRVSLKVDEKKIEMEVIPKREKKKTMKPIPPINMKEIVPKV